MKTMLLRFKDGHFSEKMITNVNKDVYVGYNFPQAEVIQIKEDGKIISDTKIGDRLYTIEELELLTDFFTGVLKKIVGS